ncbi:MAG: hypothetical protein P8Y68_03420 [Anaerolineales bacterium]
MKNDIDFFSFLPGSLEQEFSKAMEHLEKEDALNRLWQHDYTLWSNKKDEIVNRLGWLNLHNSMQPKLNEIEEIAHQLQEERFEHAILLGMGGSSLAPEMFSKIFKEQPRFLDLKVLDSTDPGAVKNIHKGLELEKTIFLVSSKSGGTVETLSFFKYFYNLLGNQLGEESTGRYFIAITDPGSPLEKLGYKLNFRKVFLNDPNIGGRYSALSFFGLVPAGLVGIDIKSLLEQARIAAENNQSDSKTQASIAAMLGGLIGIGALNGKDKLTFISDGTISSFSDWIEQLIAESSGKSGTGIVPVVGEQLAADISAYGPDRLFVILSFGDANKFEVISEKLKSAGHPVVHFRISNKYQIGRLILIWEIATALAGHIMNIHPFNQPNVEAAKELARETVKSYQETGQLPDQSNQKLTPEAIERFLSEINPGDYIAIQAFVNPTDQVSKAFREFQTVLRDKYKTAVTFGFGPRFLHSTGQLHKGDSGNGLFLQFISESDIKLNIPRQAGSQDSFITFDVLKRAQAIGDARALRNVGRRLISFYLNEPITDQIREISTRII